MLQDSQFKFSLPVFMTPPYRFAGWPAICYNEAKCITTERKPCKSQFLSNV